MIALGAAAVVAACSEDIESGAACPALCPNEALATRDTVLNLVVLDTSIAGYPGTGREGTLLVAARGDTLDTRVVVRFDTLPTTFTPAGDTARPFTELTSVTLVAPVDTGRTSFAAPIAVEAYDVDAGAVDTTAAVLLPLFRSDRLLGRQSYASKAALGDTLRVAIDQPTVLARMRAGGRLRLGLRVTSPTASSAQVSVYASNLTGAGARLRLRVPTDTVARDVALTSRTPASPSGVAADLRDFEIVARAPAAAASAQLAAGGVYGRRALLQFSAPGAFLDSATLVRATLELTQLPNRAALDPARPVTIYLQSVTANQALSDTITGGALRDPRRVASFVCSPSRPTTADSLTTYCQSAVGTATRLDSIVRAPRDSGVVRVEVADLVRLWQQPATPASGRAIVLRAPLAENPAFESLQGGELLFASKEAAAALRPRLRVTYVARSSYALP